MRLIILFLLFSCSIFSQDSLKTYEFNLSNSITGIYSVNKITQFNVNFNGENNVSRKNFSLNANTAYSFTYSDKVVGNEIQQKNNLDYKDFFFLHVYSHSLIRKIENDNSFGLGFCKRWESFSLSYAALYQKTNYLVLADKEIYRHSVRVKMKLTKKKVAFNFEYYLQPNIKNFSDFIVYGNSKLTLFKDKKVNLIFANNLNYISLSEVKLIHSISVGIGANLEKITYKRK